MSLKEPLTQLQVDAAGRLHEDLRQWRLSDAALAELHTVRQGQTWKLEFGDACGNSDHTLIQGRL